MYRRQTFQKNVSMPFGTNRVLVAASPQPSFTFLSPLSLSVSLSLSLCHGATAPSVPGPPHYRSFTITLTHYTREGSPLGKRSARRTEFYLTTHSTYKRQTSMTPAGFEPAIPTSELPQTHALDRAAAGDRIYIFLFTVIQIL